MTGFFELFNPGLRHAREQKDFDKVAVVPTRKGGRGPLQIDLDGGTVTLPGVNAHLSEVAVSGSAVEDRKTDSGPLSQPAPEAQAADSTPTVSIRIT